MRLGLGARLALAFGLFAAIMALATAAVSSASTQGELKRDVDRFLSERADDIAEGRRLRPSPRRGDGNNDQPPDEGDGVDGAIDSVLRAVEADAEVQVLDESGQILATASVELPVDEADLAFVDKRSTPLLRTVDVDGVEYRMITRHIDGGGAVQVAQSLAETNDLLGRIQTRILLLGVGLSGVAALIGWGIASRTTRPLRQLARSVESVAATQDLSVRVGVDRTDEIGRLADEFDHMLATLAESREQQQRLVQDAAHELRTPLTSVRANIDFLERADDLDDPTRQEILASIKAELGELSVVLAEVVELATESHDPGAYAPVDLARVADIALAQFELRSARVAVRNLKPSTVLADESMLSRAAANLIGNADKYSPPDLPIIVTVADGALSVADLGPGIPPADRARVFDRFYRMDQARSAPGSGLGLAIVKKIATEHGGSVWVTDNSPNGAVVGFTLPEHSDLAG